MLGPAHCYQLLIRDRLLQLLEMQGSGMKSDTSQSHLCEPEAGEW